MTLGILTLGLKPLLVSGKAQGTSGSENKSRLITVRNLEAYVNILIPADTTPSAGDLNVHHQLLQRAETVQDYPLLLHQGCLWLERRARQQWQKPFHELREGYQQILVEETFGSAPQSLARVFAEWVRKDAMNLFYSHPESWSGLPFSRPPQPLGFPGSDTKPVVVR